MPVGGKSVGTDFQKFRTATKKVRTVTKNVYYGSNTPELGHSEADFM
jgi:hypothetical protein